MKMLLTGLLGCLALAAGAQETAVTIDLRQVAPAAAPTPLPMRGTRPNGETLSVNNRYFEKDGVPWYPLMGEMHYNRVPPAAWEQSLRLMKSAGLSVVATYVFWNEHETAPGHWDWTGNRDLRRFIECCRRAGLYVWLRMGPWSHGEQLNGGFPPWIQAMQGKRTNDTAYLRQAKGLFDQIGRQTRGLFFEDGGPVIGVQLENEYASGQPGHIATLKQLALDAHIRPVFWSVTANTVFDDNQAEVIPLQGSYPYRGWEPAGGRATMDFLYGNDQWIMTDAVGRLFYDFDKYPRGLCEQGCGSQMTYANRFTVDPAVVEAHLQNQVGRGMNMVGYYMFRGGTQTPGLKEPGLPESYDFQAPIGEFGYTRPSYRYLKTIHLFLDDFGSSLAAMPVVPPERPVRDPYDTASLRYIVREKDGSGYVFLCNTQVRVHMPDKRVRLTLRLPGETVAFPSFLMKGQTAPILPFNLHAGGVTLRYVTAQPLARIEDASALTLFFERLPGVDPVVAIGDSVIRARSPVRLRGTDGRRVTLVFLSRQDALRAWRLDRSLVLADGDLTCTGDSIELRQWDNPRFVMSVYSPGDTSPRSYAYTRLSRRVPVTVRYEPGGAEGSISLPDTLSRDLGDAMVSITYHGDQCRVLRHDSVIADNLYNGTPWLLGVDKFLGGGPLRLDCKGQIDKIRVVPQYRLRLPWPRDAVVMVPPAAFENASPALRTAVRTCLRTGARVLELPGGRIDCWPSGADQKELYISNDTEDDTLSKVKSIALCVEGARHLTIEGHHTLLVLHGKMVSFAFLHCRDIRLRDIQVDYERPTMTEMTIRSVSPDSVDAWVHPDDRFWIDDTGRIHLYGEGWEARSFHAVAFDPATEYLRYASFGPFLRSRATAMGPSMVRFHASPQAGYAFHDVHPGDILTIRDPYRDNAGAFIDESRDVALEDVDMYYMHGLGIVSQFSENLDFRGVRIAPRPGSGRVISAFADCFHFSGCRGRILLDSCLTSGSHDDPVNVHGTHLRITAVAGDVLSVRFMHPQTWGFQPFFPGDSIAYVDPYTLLYAGYAVVRSVIRQSPRVFGLRLTAPPPAAVHAGDCVENITWTPAVTIRRSRFERTDTRGILVTTRRKILIEDNTFYHTGMHAILIADDALSWYESGPVRDVTIRRNRFAGCAPGDYVIAIAPENRKTVPGAYVHRNIRIEDNDFDTPDGRLLSAHSVDGLTFLRNRVVIHGDSAKTPYRVADCAHVQLQDF